jgi:hypothetical protein
VPEKGPGKIVPKNSDPIIPDMDQPTARGIDDNGNAGRSRIETVFRDLLENGSRTLHDLAGRNLVDK